MCHPEFRQSGNGIHVTQPKGYWDKSIQSPVGCNLNVFDLIAVSNSAAFLQSDSEILSLPFQNKQQKQTNKQTNKQKPHNWWNA